MQIIHSFFVKFLALFKNNLKQAGNKINQKESISFTFIDDKTINIECLFPNVEKLSASEIALASEKFAKLLSKINTGELSSTIINRLEENSKSSSLQIQLYIKNIVSFWELFDNEFIKRTNKKYLKLEPLIRPISVFSSSNK